MRTTILLAVLFVGCGVSEADLNDVGNESAEELGELGTSTRSYVVFRRDMRKCVAPMCGGFWVHDVNRSTLNEMYVSGFDFSQSNLRGLPEHQGDVTGAGNFEVVLYGKLGPTESRFNTRTFLVTEAWRGMPGVTFTEPADTFVKVQAANIQCIAAPCATLRASKLHTTTKTLFHDLDLTRTAKEPLVDQDWLTFRITDKDAIVAGRFVNGAQVGVGTEKVLDASQVFVHLPDMTQSCPRLAVQPACPSGQVQIWTRNENRCPMPAGCSTNFGTCRFAVPTCSAGYELQTWKGGAYGCDRYVCDPAFLND